MTGILVSTLLVDGWTQLGSKEIVTVTILKIIIFKLSYTFIFLSLYKEPWALIEFLDLDCGCLFKVGTDSRFTLKQNKITNKKT